MLWRLLLRCLCRAFLSYRTRSRYARVLCGGIRIQVKALSPSFLVYGGSVLRAHLLYGRGCRVLFRGSSGGICLPSRIKVSLLGIRGSFFFLRTLLRRPFQLPHLRSGLLECLPPNLSGTWRLQGRYRRRQLRTSMLRTLFLRIRSSGPRNSCTFYRVLQVRDCPRIQKGRLLCLLLSLPLRLRSRILLRPRLSHPSVLLRGLRSRIPRSLLRLLIRVLLSDY